MYVLYDYMITNGSLKTTVHHLSLFFTFFEVCIT